MKKPLKKIAAKKQNEIIESAVPEPALELSFIEIISLIQQARQQALHVVNTTLIDLYWRIGEYISHKVATVSRGC